MVPAPTGDGVPTTPNTRPESPAVEVQAVDAQITNERALVGNSTPSNEIEAVDAIRSLATTEHSHLLEIDLEERSERRNERRTNQRIMRCTLGLFVASAISTYLLHQQIKDQADLSAVTIADMKKRTEAALRSAAAAENNLMQNQEATAKTLANMKNSADAALRLAGTAEATLKQNRDATSVILQQNQDALDRTLQQNDRAVRATLAQGQEQLDATYELFKLDQRPWLAAADFTLSAEPTDNMPIEVNLTYRNTGKTPAIRVRNLTQLWMQRSTRIVQYSRRARRSFRHRVSH